LRRGHLQPGAARRPRAAGLGRVAPGRLALSSAVDPHADATAGRRLTLGALVGTDLRRS
jgi:hypothetical protein